ncbi:penicillin-binding protein 1C [Litorimonas sp. RW-G-Af-16]|uniref:penicillin-binding protein 1C n=1 Tax=Litorimonas sp. RW-G-Af-16 TaxID=3241168 RepID=UPI00390C998A
MQRWRKIAYGVGISVAALGAIYFAQSPVSDEALADVSPVVLDRHGAWLTAFALEDGRWRFPADLDTIDPAFIEALVQIEDRRFATHVGVDIPAIFRAAKDWYKQGEIVSGASTITMQLVRQYKPRPRTLRSKVIESFEALRFELHFSKDEILSQYLTRISYGGNIEGIEAASRIYLGKSPRHLSPDEIALLIALPQAPEARRPDRQAAHAKRGRDRILARLEGAGVLSAEAANEAKTSPIPLTRSELPQNAWLSAHYMEKTGAQTASYIDRVIQNSLSRHLESYVARYPKTVNASAVIVHNATQEIRAHAAIGARDHDGGWIDMTRRVRSPGSTLKPFVYGLGADDGILAFDSLVKDAPSRFGSYQPENFNRRYHGDVTVSEALQHSLNIPAVAVLDHVGGRRLQAALMASGAKLSQTRSENPDTGLALALGGTGMTALDLASLYVALANDGEARPLRWHKDQEAGGMVRLLTAKTANELVEVMAKAPVPEGHIPGDILEGRPAIAYKTGTSYGFRDSWAAGIAGDYTVVVWVGRPDGAPRPGVTGRKAAAPLMFEIVGELDVPKVKAIRQVESSARHDRVSTPDDIGPQIIFPAKDAEIAVKDFGQKSRGVTILAETSHGPARVYVNGDPIAQQREGYIWRPDGPGFYQLSAVDQRGKITKSAFRVLSQDQIIDAPF